MNWQDAVAYLESLSRFGSNLGLERMEKLLARIGNPHREINCLHIAGTNGKGSTVAMLSAVLQEAGLRVGTYTSPHLSSFCERIAINGEPISQAAVTELVEELAPEARAVDGLTKFEFLTAMAFCYFQRQKPELVLLEVGLGGRLDATNVAAPVACGITHLALEHTQRLGNTLSAIAWEKAGIIKPGRPVVTAPQETEARCVLERRAKELGAPLWQVASWPEAGQIRYRGRAFSLAGSEADFWLGEHFWPQVAVGLLGRHQLTNAGVALGLAQIAYRGGLVKLSAESWQQAVYRGLAQARWPGRLEFFSGQPSLLLDGAHNPDGMRTLAGAIREFFSCAKPMLVLGILGDKDAQQMLSILAPLAGSIVLTRPDNPRALEPESLAAIARRFCKKVEVIPEPALALERALNQRELVVVAGSLYLVGQLRPSILRFFSL